MFSLFRSLNTPTTSLLTESNLLEANESLNLTENHQSQIIGSKSNQIDEVLFDDFDDNEIYLCLVYQSNKLACSYYDSNKRCLFFMSETQESHKFELTNILIDDLEPYCVITSPRCDPKFINFLKQKCKYRLNNNTSISDEILDKDTEILEIREKRIQFVPISSSEFNFESCKERIFRITTIESMPKNMNQSEKILFFSSLIDFDSKLAVKSTGGLIKYLTQNRVNYELDRDVYETPILTIKRMDLKDLLIIDENSFKSLEIFNDVDYTFAYKQTNRDTLTFRTHLNDKFNNTLYSLFLSKIKTKFGIGKLRSFMMRPTRDLKILNDRNKIINFLNDTRNQEMIQMIVKNLKKCKYINPIFKRLRITRCSLNEWKRLYKTTQSFLELCKVKRILNNHLGLETLGIDLEPRFDFLINLFERTINLKESNEKSELKINVNISRELDEKRLMYSQLPEFLTGMAHREMNTHNLNSCKMTYLHLFGYLLTLTVDDINFDFDHVDPNEQLALFEQQNRLKFVFKSNELLYYKSDLCYDLDKKIGDLATEINDIECQILDNLQLNFIKYSHLYAYMIDFCGELDCYLSFASIALENDYTRPLIDFKRGSFIDAKKVRHPLVELNFDSISTFIPNDIETGQLKPKIKVITSPNASGKTSYLKQVGLIVYMTFIGSYVPGVNVQVGNFDRILTRLKSNESLTLQMSSYSIDVKQAADAVNSSTCKSLILIDEFGSGTNIFDGQSVVAALLRYWSNLDDSKRPSVFLSTHFYEMLHSPKFFFDKNIDKLEFLTFDFMFDSDENQDKTIVFLYKLKQGLTSSSYAINVVKKYKPSDLFDVQKSLDKIMDFIEKRPIKGSDEFNEKANDMKNLMISAKSSENFIKAKEIVKDWFQMCIELRNENKPIDEEACEKRGEALCRKLENLKFKF